MKYNCYAVFDGFEIGIFNTWEETKPLVDGYSNSDFKGYATRQEAEEAFKTDPAKRKRKVKAKPKSRANGKSKFYVVLGDCNPAIYDKLRDAQNLVKGYLNSYYEIFGKYEDAVKFLEKILGR